MSRNDSTGRGADLLADDWLADLRDVPLLPGVVAGAVAWLVGYGLMALLFYLGPASLGAGSTGERLRGIGVIFYNAQFVDGIETITSANLQETVRFNVILEQGSTAVPTFVYFAIPFVALVAVGAVLGYRAITADVEYVTIALLGVAVAIGYLPLAVAGSFVVELSVGWSLGTLLLEPDLVESAAFGFAYPFVVGTLGVAVGYVVQR
ncbi:hypothetical protein Hrd1104_08325 [Halorhabdus sp. CBA1104]|uniref:hypothetical protein n=1 Tax=unclassified Halorhabdus TaxID=2621901 RepID=UPI0012B40D3F|nr:MULTISPECIES: hypothetical protein [unclassified Halorhabdus]QGN07309.1 hypothetical protein Hrd1104_08325 [Halorhabdus sp. CBA1104]